MNKDIESLAKYPMESDDWVITVAIGGIMSLLSFFVVPIFAITGYLVRAIRAGMEDADEPPVFDEWGELLKEGVVAAVITVVYQLVPLIVFTVFVIGSVIALLTDTAVGAGLGVAGIVGAFFVSWVLSIVFGYVGFAGVANYAKEGTFAAGFDVDTITDVVTSGEYMMAWAYVIGLQIVVGVVVTALNFVPIVGAIAGVFVSFYALIISGWLWGDGFASALAASVDVDRDVEATPA